LSQLLGLGYRCRSVFEGIMFRRFTLREILFATVAIAELIALSITSPTRKQYEDTGANALTTSLLQRTLESSDLRARILGRQFEGRRVGHNFNRFYIERRFAENTRCNAARVGKPLACKWI
jgi:hypothetical protein